MLNDTQQKEIWDKIGVLRVKIIELEQDVENPAAGEAAYRSLIASLNRAIAALRVRR
jgi:triphosphoribosyl-dephospho-CoA synthetase